MNHVLPPPDRASRCRDSVVGSVPPLFAWNNRKKNLLDQISHCVYRCLRQNGRAFHDNVVRHTGTWRVRRIGCSSDVARSQTRGGPDRVRRMRQETRVVDGSPVRKGLSRAPHPVRLYISPFLFSLQGIEICQALSLTLLENFLNWGLPLREEGGQVNSK